MGAPRLRDFTEAWRILQPPKDFLLEADDDELAQLRRAYPFPGSLAHFEAVFRDLLPEALALENAARLLETPAAPELTAILDRIPTEHRRGSTSFPKLAVQRVAERYGKKRNGRSEASRLRPFLTFTSPTPRLGLGGDFAQDFVLRVVVFAPTHDMSHPSIREHRSVTVEILGQQSLGELRRAIVCSGDYVDSPPRRRDFFFYIGGQFYCGHEAKGHEIKPLLKWLERQEEAQMASDEGRHAQQDSLQRRSLATAVQEAVDSPDRLETRLHDAHATKIEDIRGALARRYLFCHGRGCEHSIVLEDLRLYDPEIDGGPQDFPKVEGADDGPRCTACGAEAVHACVGDKLAEESPAYFCAGCHYDLHYDVRGKALYTDYEIYPCVPQRSTDAE